MKQKYKFLSIVFAIFFLSFFLVFPQIVFAEDPQITDCASSGKTQSADGTTCECPPGQAEVGTAGSQTCAIVNPAPGQLVSFSNVDALIVRVVQILLSVAGAVAVIFIMIGGFRYITSRGNEETTEIAKKTITNAVLGVVIIVMAFAIITIVNNLLTKTPPS